MGSIGVDDQILKKVKKKLVNSNDDLNNTELANELLKLWLDGNIKINPRRVTRI